VNLFARGERLCAAGKALAARGVDDCRTWQTEGFRSGAHWLATKTGATVGDAERSLRTARALDELPEDYRMAVVLSDVEELSYKEIADIMGCPIGTVMSRLHRGRRLLKGRLYEHARAMGIVDPEAEVGLKAEPVAQLDQYRARKAVHS
jgi:DNA-directed RNA polymerase specialized sigma24 family protein